MHEVHHRMPFSSAITSAVSALQAEQTWSTGCLHSGVVPSAAGADRAGDEGGVGGRRVVLCFSMASNASVSIAPPVLFLHLGLGHVPGARDDQVLDVRHRELRGVTVALREHLLRRTHAGAVIRPELGLGLSFLRHA